MTAEPPAWLYDAEGRVVLEPPAVRLYLRLLAGATGAAAHKGGNPSLTDPVG